MLFKIQFSKQRLQFACNFYYSSSDKTISHFHSISHIIKNILIYVTNDFSNLNCMNCYYLKISSQGQSFSMFSLLTPIKKKSSEQFLTALLRYDLQTLRNHLQEPFCVTRSFVFQSVSYVQISRSKTVKTKGQYMFKLKKHFAKCPPVLTDTPISKLLECSSYSTLVSMSSSSII